MELLSVMLEVPDVILCLTLEQHNVMLYCVLETLDILSSAWLLMK